GDRRQPPVEPPVARVGLADDGWAVGGRVTFDVLQRIRTAGITKQRRRRDRHADDRRLARRVRRPGRDFARPNSQPLPHRDGGGGGRPGLPPLRLFGAAPPLLFKASPFCRPLFLRSTLFVRATLFLRQPRCFLAAHFFRSARFFGSTRFLGAVPPLVFEASPF